MYYYKSMFNVCLVFQGVNKMKVTLTLATMALMLLLGSVGWAGDVGNMDILGVKLGMSPSQVKEAIQKSYPNAQIKIIDDLLKSHLVEYQESELKANLGGDTLNYFGVSFTKKPYGNGAYAIQYVRGFTQPLNKSDRKAL